MQDSFEISESDLELVHALQLAPRAPWSRLAPILETDPVTLARRWQRLSDLGIVRATASVTMSMMGGHIMAHVLVSCSLGEAKTIATTLAQDPNVFTIRLSSGAFPITLILAARDLGHLTEYLTERLGRLPGVTSVSTHVQTALLIDGSSWELRALSQNKRAQVITLQRPVSARRGSLPEGVDAEIFALLMADGRISHAEIARHLGLSLSSARRRTEALIASKSITLRCDVANLAFGWPVEAYLDARIQGSLESFIARLRAEVGEIRILTTSASSHAVHMHLWLRSITDLPRVESKITAIVPDLIVGSRSILLHPVKQIGHLQDSMGRSIGIVPPGV